MTILSSNECGFVGEPPSGGGGSERRSGEMGMREASGQWTRSRRGL